MTTDTETANSLLIDGIDNLARYLELQRDAIRQLARELILRSPADSLDVVQPIAHDMARLAEDSKRISDSTRAVVAQVTAAKFERMELDEYGGA